MQSNPREISIDEYDYPLPEGRIAQFPLEARDCSKLLICNKGNLSDDIFRNIGNYLPENSLIILNETKVIHARLVFLKESGSRIEIFCLEPLEPRDVQLAFQQKGSCKWKCLVGNAKRWKHGVLNLVSEIDGVSVVLKAEIVERKSDYFEICFGWGPGHLTFSQVLETFGRVPLPPYILRDASEMDSLRYQTVFAQHEGSVAAPTAGLHLTPEVIDSLKKKNIDIARITLHVGAGTFRPVNAELLGSHVMHREEVIIPVEIIAKLAANKDRPIVLVGTTTVRAIESMYWQGLMWLKNEPVKPDMNVGQWDPYILSEQPLVSPKVALQKVLLVLEEYRQKQLRGHTSLMIAPGYDYQFPDMIITNFHQPRSTLLLLVSAFAGEDWRDAYDYALQHDFRFLSYGDSCLFIK